MHEVRVTLRCAHVPVSRLAVVLGPSRDAASITLSYDALTPSCRIHPFVVLVARNDFILHGCNKLGRQSSRGLLRTQAVGFNNGGQRELCARREQRPISNRNVEGSVQKSRRREHDVSAAVRWKSGIGENDIPSPYSLRRERRVETMGLTHRPPRTRIQMASAPAQDLSHSRSKQQHFALTSRHLQ